MKTKEELLKIYGAYAPYKLHILHIEKNMRLIISGCYFHENMDENIQLKLLNWDSKVNSDEAKPILYSMGMLTKEIEHNGEKFVPMELIGKIIDEDYKGLSEDEDGCIVGKDVNPRCVCPYDCDCQITSYNLFYNNLNFYSTVYIAGDPENIIEEIAHESYLLVQKLLEWHFNVFGLDETEYIKKESLK